ADAPRRSKLAEAAVELPLVQAVHVAVAVVIEVPQVAGVTSFRTERGPEQLAGLPVHVPLALRVAEQPDEALPPPAPRRPRPRPGPAPAPSGRGRGPQGPSGCNCRPPGSRRRCPVR